MEENSFQHEWELVLGFPTIKKYKKYFVIKHISCKGYAGWSCERCLECNKQVPKSIIFQRNLLYENYKSESK